MRQSLHVLRRIHPPGSIDDRSPLVTDVQCELIAESDWLTASFEVKTGKPPFTNPDLPIGASQWGLWDWDVVELFVSAPNGDYFEFQVSPLGQSFELRIFEPRRRFDRAYASGAIFEAKQGPAGSWSGRIRVPRQAIEWDGDPHALRGGLFTILGASDERTYWSAFLPNQEKPDFHLPEFFKPLF